MAQDTTTAEEETTTEEEASEEQENGSQGGFFQRIRERLSRRRGGDDEEEGDGGEQGMTKKLRLHIKLAQDVAVPRETAYNQWTQLEDFPQFMKGVQSVELDDDDEDPGNITYSNWTVKIGITRRQFSAEVTEAIPDERIAWKATGGCEHKGVVSFARLDDEQDNLTRVQVQMEYIPGDLIEKIGNIFLAARRKARKDLRLYKHYMELTGEETGAWRGEIPPPEEAEEEYEEGEEVEEPAAEETEEGEEVEEPAAEEAEEPAAEETEEGEEVEEPAAEETEEDEADRSNGG